MTTGLRPGTDSKSVLGLRFLLLVSDPGPTTVELFDQPKDPREEPGTYTQYAIFALKISFIIIGK